MKKYRIIEEASNGYVRFYIEERYKKFFIFTKYKRVGWSCDTEQGVRSELERLLAYDVLEKRKEEERKSHPKYKKVIKI